MLEAPAARALDAKTLYERLAVRDIQDAADALRPVYSDTSRRDGYVSLEVSPLLAYDTAGTLEEARRLWRAVGRDNLMIKVPATPQGIPAIQRAHRRGHQRQRDAALRPGRVRTGGRGVHRGTGEARARGGDPRRVASVASFFISRIDTAIDALIAARLQASTKQESKASCAA